MINRIVRFVLLFVFFVFSVLAAIRIINYVQSATSGTNDDNATEFIAPILRQELKPLSTCISFTDVKPTPQEMLTEIETDWGTLTFSTYGATLERLIAKHKVGSAIQEIPVLFPAARINRARQSFLVAFSDNTPYYYELSDRQDSVTDTTVSYKAETNYFIVRKAFVVSKHMPKLDVRLELTPKRAESNATIEPRVLLSSPAIPELHKKDFIAGIVMDKNGTFKKYARESIDTQRGWFAPRLFGSEDKYFVNALVGDEYNFVQRAYYHIVDNKDIVSFLEGPVVRDHQAWLLSFYCGPKDIKTLRLVDQRLEHTLGYTGLLAPVARAILHILQTLYGYTGNYGWAIILLLLAMQLLMVPFTLQGERQLKKAKEYKKKLAYIQHRYRDDRDALAREQMELMRKYGMPGLGGCLPVLLIRMPVFFALNQVLNNAIELYKAPFLWISDLSMADPYFVFPLLVVIGMLAQSYTVDPSQRVQVIMLALIFGAISTTLSAGLTLYIAVSTILGVVQALVTRVFKLA